MKQVALEAINGGHNGHSNGQLAPANLQTLKATDQYEIIGSADNGFAVVSTDDLVPAVLGVSMKPYSEGRNTNFEWWLKAVAGAVSYAVEHQVRLVTTPPDPAKYPAAVPPMLTTEWDQQKPYNNLLPLSEGGDRCYTGCVATAMAQVLHYFKTPEHGYGQRTIYYPQYDTSGAAITATFEQDYYDWDNMLDRYNGYYTDEQAQAVALLMRDCGVAADMQYGGFMENGSGAFSQDAAAGLRTYFGLADAECLERDDYSEPEWMDIVYRELSEAGPVYYGGASYESGGHAFVLHGYNAEGLVYVNWGWSGDDDGYYNIALLNPGFYHFEIQQDMIVGIKGEPANLTEETVELTTPGLLGSVVGDEKIGTVGVLKVIGNINSTDLRQIRRLAGVDEYGVVTNGSLHTLDLSEARIVSGGQAYLIDGSRQMTTADDALPEQAFNGCKSMKVLMLPKGLKHFGAGALAGCLRLEKVQITDMGDDADFVIDNEIIWNTEKTELIALLPGISGELAIPSGTIALGNYALAGCARLSSVVIPASVETIGREALSKCVGLTAIRMAADEPPTLGGANVFDGIHFSRCKLYVPSGSESKYAQKAQWNQFRTADFDNIIGYGSSVKVRNTIRYYGEENPEFFYTVQGDPITGTPVMTCEATPTSPVGRYPIVIERGTITDEVVRLIDGYLVVQPVKATATVNDATRSVGEPNPDFTLTFTGLVNDETVPIWKQEPVFSTEADIDSPAGEYPVTVTAKAESYTLTFVAGTLTVKDAITGISSAKDGQTAASGCRDLQGRRVGTLQKKGIYIKDGKKYVVK